ncbi:hypothetical protein D9M71_276880 [compost metagenome]
MFRSAAPAPGPGPEPGDHPARGCGHLRNDRSGRHHRRVPDRVPGADVDVAEAQAQDVLRSGDRGRHRSAGADPGRHGAPVPAATEQGRAGGVSVAGTGSGAQAHPGRAAVSGAGDADRHRRRRLQPRRGRSATPLHGRLETPWRARTAQGAAGRRHEEKRLHRRVRRADLRADQGLWQLRFPRVPRRQLCLADLRQLLVEMPRTGGLRLCADQQLADGVLQPGPDSAGRSASSFAGSPGGRARQ